MLKLRIKPTLWLRWLIVFAGALLLLLGIGWWQLYRLLQPNAFRHDLQSFLSSQTGWNISFDSLNLSLLPRLHLNVKNITMQVSETADIHMDALQLYPQLISLAWGRFHLVKAVIISPLVHVRQTPVSSQPKSLPPNFFRDDFEQHFLSAAVRISGYFAHGLILIENGSLALESGQRRQISLDHIQALINFPPQGLKIQAAARESSHSRPVAFSGRLAYSPGRIDFFQVSGSYPPSSFSNLNGHFEWQTAPRLMIASGELIPGPNALLPKVRLKTPIIISSSEIDWSQNSRVGFNAKLKFPENLSLALTGTWSGNLLSISHLGLKDDLEKADLTCQLTDQTLDFTFAGNASSAMYDKIFLERAPENLKVSGNFSLHADKNNFQAFSAKGDLQLSHLFLKAFSGAPLTLNSLKCSAQGRVIAVHLEDLAWGKTRFSALGVVQPQSSVYSVNLTVSAKTLDVDALISNLTTLSDLLSNSTTASAAASPWQLSFQVFAQNALFDGYNFSPMQAYLRVAPLRDLHTIDIRLDSANLGGMTAGGKIHVQDGVISLEITPTASHQDLQKFLDALSPQAPRWNGFLDISGRITGQGKQAELVNSLHGTVAFKATQGRIYNFTFLSQILSLINISEILVGTVPGIGKAGVGYSDCSLKGSLENGKYRLDEAILKADNMDITGKGTIGLEKDNLDLVVLVAPFKTVNRIINFLPLVNYLFNNHLVAFPISVKGTLADPKMNYAIISSDEGIFGILKRTLLLPVYLASPLFTPKSSPTPGHTAVPASVSATVQNQ